MQKRIAIVVTSFVFFCLLFVLLVSSSEKKGIDTNNDGKIDRWVSQDDHFLKVETDQNQDGRIDAWAFFGIAPPFSPCEFVENIDSNYDGKVDCISFTLNHNIEAKTYVRRVVLKLGNGSNNVSAVAEDTGWEEAEKSSVVVHKEQCGSSSNVAREQRGNRASP